MINTIGITRWPLGSKFGEYQEETTTRTINNYRFGTNNICFAPVKSKNFSCCHKIIIRYGDNSNFSNSNKEIFIGGKPLSLKQYKYTILNTNFKPYAIESISISSSSYTNNYYIMIDGTKILTSKNNKNNFFLTSHIQEGLANIKNQTIFKGMPLSIGENNELIFINSIYNENDIENYDDIYIGGNPLTVGQINNKWYLLIC